MEESEADGEGKDLELDDVAVGSREGEEHQSLGDMGKRLIRSIMRTIFKTYQKCRGASVKDGRANGNERFRGPFAASPTCVGEGMGYVDRIVDA